MGRLEVQNKKSPLIDLRPMAVEYIYFNHICSENARWLLSLHNTSL